jgi:serine/threonine protein kinase
MTSLSHPNVVKFKNQECDQESNQQAIVMEYMPMNLQHFIEQCVASSDTGFPFSRLAELDMISLIACAMEYLHGQQLVHCDLKPNNILLSPIITIPELSADGYGKVKFCDFGLLHRNLNNILKYVVSGPGGRQKPLLRKITPCLGSIAQKKLIFIGSL